MLATNFGGLCPKVTNFGCQNFGYQIWFCTRLIILSISPEGDRDTSAYKFQTFSSIPSPGKGRKTLWTEGKTAGQTKGLVGWMKRWYFVLQTDGWTTRKHYSDIIMSAMASQITSIIIVYSTVYSFMHRSKKTSKLRVTGLCERNSPLSSEFPAQSASTAENVSIWWRYHAMIMPQESKGRAIKMEWKKIQEKVSFLTSIHKLFSKQRMVEFILPSHSTAADVYPSEASSDYTSWRCCCHVLYPWQPAMSVFRHDE